MTDTGFTNSKFVKTTEKLFLKVTSSIYLAPLWGGTPPPQITYDLNSLRCKPTKVRIEALHSS